LIENNFIFFQEVLRTNKRRRARKLMERVSRTWLSRKKNTTAGMRTWTDEKMWEMDKIGTQTTNFL
jgi:hypothetical protein